MKKAMIAATAGVALFGTGFLLGNVQNKKEILGNFLISGYKIKKIKRWNISWQLKKINIQWRKY